MSNGGSKNGESQSLNGIQMKCRDNVSTRQEMTNPHTEIKPDIVEGKTSIQYLRTMMTRLGYIFSHRNSDARVLQDLAFAHPDSLRLWEIFPYVMIIDTTYKTNRYEMPLLEIVGVTCSEKTFHMGFAFMSIENEDTYTWVLRQVKGWITNHPKVIVTNTEQGLLKAIPSVYLDAHHMLCLVHVERNIEDMSLMYTHGSTHEQTHFLADSKKLIRCRTMEKYETQLASMHERWGAKWELMEYLESSWLIYREKLVYLWTDHYLHLGNRTTNRIELAHASLKKHLQSTVRIDRCLEHIQTTLHDQIYKVGVSLDYSNYKSPSKIYDLPIFRYLKGNVSDVCLDKLYEIFMSVFHGNVSPSECWNHWRRLSYGLPCLHEVAVIIKEERPFLIEDVHVFWRKVWYQVSGEDNLHKNAPTIGELVKSYRCVELENEEMVQTAEGSLKKNMTISQKVQKGHKLRNKKSSCGPKGSRSSGQKCDKVIDVDTDDGHKRKHGALLELPEIKTSYFNFERGNLDTFMAIYVVGVKDVARDGNCGFRALAELLRKGEGVWPEIRKAMFWEVERNPQRYEPFLRESSSISGYLAKLNWLVEGVDAPEFFWMAMPESGVVFATLYQCTVVSLDYDNPVTCLPLARQTPAPGAPSPGTIVVICRLRTKLHFIPVWLTDGFPMPPVMGAWYNHRDQSVDGMDVQYASRIQLFQFYRKVHGRPTT